ncbi:serine/threonine protein kinase [Streptomyces triticagri]|uniref:Serine/threonine protein kinase n=1 Tax=Streptomyces triticagri TaxID=2293568 RepID=A0A372MCD4_9ACTN|nr:serine/threonine-protein kinase [Streptomyces triticagri]RFU88586.1 serine/threonine protein kinase [Streptomyces triticagri]RFU88604.1 serine/threonine protein kinase [Streptomyces triticagri]
MAMMRLRREDPRVVGSFRLHRRLGAGGMGVVYLGSDRRGQRVALKVIRPDLAEDQEFRSRFAREVSAARRIRGGCTARLVAADLEAERPWFATQYVPGPSLHDKVAEEGPLSAAEVAAVGSALSEGLVAVHEAGVVHRDLKPSNILLSPKGPRIIDFGIAWATGASTLTHVGTAVGSPGFLAPEQVRGAAVTPATDVFSLGATLAYAAMGDSPFGHGSSEVMLYRVVHETAQLRGVPDALAPLLSACLAKDPEERPSTLQLSLRLKEIAAREAHGLTDTRAPAPRRESDRPSVGRSAEERTESQAHRRASGSGTTGAQRASGARVGQRPPAQRNTTRPGRRPAPRSGAGRPASRTTGTGRRVPANPRLLRQRLVVFVVVTLLVALGIAAAQGCQGPAQGFGGAGSPRSAEVGGAVAAVKSQAVTAGSSPTATRPGRSTEKLALKTTPPPAERR